MTIIMIMFVSLLFFSYFFKCVYSITNHENNGTTSGKFHGYMNTAKVGYKEKIIFEKEVEIYKN